MKKKNGIENTRLTIERRKENSNAPILNRTFFCDTAAKADRKEDSRAIANQVIMSS